MIKTEIISRIPGEERLYLWASLDRRTCFATLPSHIREFRRMNPDLWHSTLLRAFWIQPKWKSNYIDLQDIRCPENNDSIRCCLHILLQVLSIPYFYLWISSYKRIKKLSLWMSIQNEVSLELFFNIQEALLTFETLRNYLNSALDLHNAIQLCIL